MDCRLISVDHQVISIYYTYDIEGRHQMQKFLSIIFSFFIGITMMSACSNASEPVPVFDQYTGTDVFIECMADVAGTPDEASCYDAEITIMNMSITSGLMDMKRFMPDTEWASMVHTQQIHDLYMEKQCTTVGAWSDDPRQYNECIRRITTSRAADVIQLHEMARREVARQSASR